MGTVTNTRPAHAGRAGNRWGFAAAALLTLGVAGCASVGTPPAGDASSSGPTTVRIRNDGSSALAVYSQTGGTRLTTVSPRQTECVRIPPTSKPDQLVAEPVDGGVSTTSNSFTVRPGDGWTWMVPAPEGASADLVPSRPCTPPATNAP